MDKKAELYYMLYSLHKNKRHWTLQKMLKLDLILQVMNYIDHYQKENIRK